MQTNVEKMKKSRKLEEDTPIRKDKVTKRKRKAQRTAKRMEEEI